MDIKIYNSKNDNTIFNTKNWVEYTEEVERALEKQISQKVIRIEDVASQACSICKSKVNWNYCSNCGQKLVY